MSSTLPLKISAEPGIKVALDAVARIKLKMALQLPSKTKHPPVQQNLSNASKEKDILVQTSLLSAASYDLNAAVRESPISSKAYITSVIEKAYAKPSVTKKVAKKHAADSHDTRIVEDAMNLNDVNSTNSRQTSLKKEIMTEIASRKKKSVASLDISTKETQMEAQIDIVPLTIDKTQTKSLKAKDSTSTSKTGKDAESVAESVPLDISYLVSHYGLPSEVVPAIASAVAKGVLSRNQVVLAGFFSRVLGKDYESAFGRDLLVAILRKQPALLKMPAKTMREKLQLLVQELDCEAEQVKRILACQPSLWGQRIETTRGKVQALENLLDLDHQSAIRLVRKSPGLLSCDPDTLANKFKSFKALMARPHREVVKVVVENPAVLFLNEESLRSKFAMLQRTLELGDPKVLSGMIIVRPMIATSSAATLAATWMSVKACISTSARWRREVLKLGPSTRASLLLAGRLKHRRLTFLVAARQQEAASLSSVTSMSQAAFLKAYPNYRVWARSQP